MVEGGFATFGGLAFCWCVCVWGGGGGGGGGRGCYFRESLAAKIFVDVAFGGWG